MDLLKEFSVPVTLLIKSPKSTSRRSQNFLDIDFFLCSIYVQVILNYATVVLYDCQLPEIQD